jgi:hypothetical protein
MSVNTMVIGPLGNAVIAVNSVPLNAPARE